MYLLHHTKHIVNIIFVILYMKSYQKQKKQKKNHLKLNQFISNIVELPSLLNRGLISPRRGPRRPAKCGR